MQTTTKTNLWLLTIGAFFAFFVFGFTDNLKGPALPAILQDLQISYATGGAILTGIYIGFTLASFSTGFLADSFGHKLVLVLAGVCLVVGILGLMVSRTPLVLAGWMLVVGFGLGSLELGCNALIVLLHPTDKARYLNLMAVMHGMGSMVAPLYAGWLLAAGASWRTLYRWDLILGGLLIVYFLLVRSPQQSRDDQQAFNFRQLGAQAFSPRMLLYYFAQMIYVAAEIGIASWLVEFLQEVHSQGIQQSNQALALFFGLIMAGRLIGSFLVERFGYLRSVLLASLAASVCVALGLFGPVQFAVLLPVSGLFLSIIFPTITAAVSGSVKEKINSILGLLFAFAGLGGLLGPWLVGVASDWAGIRAGFSLNLAFGLLTALSALVLLGSKPAAPSS